MITYRGDHRAILNGVPIVHLAGKDVWSKKTTDEEIILLRPLGYFPAYKDLVWDARSILAVGIFQGGSVLISASQWPNATISAIDIDKENPAVRRHLERMGYADRVHLHYETRQENEAGVLTALASLPSSPDLVIDDASHLYGPTRKTFETVFPRMLPGSKYIIEDWAVGLWPGGGFDSEKWEGPSLANLVFELTMASASSTAMVAKVEIDYRFAIVTRGKAPPSEAINVDDLILLNKRTWSGLTLSPEAT